MSETKKLNQIPVDKLIDMEIRKALHVSFTKETHTEMRVMLFRKGLSCQYMFNEFANMLVDRDKDVMRILDRIVKEKRDKTIEKYSRTDADSIYNLLEEESPFCEK
jgi:predicted KAP-like P-loop ATPase